MKRISLKWYDLGGTVDLSGVLVKSVSSSDRKYPALSKYGFYMYLSQNLSQIIYIGQGSGKGRPLRNRIRWELLRGSKLSRDLKENGIDKLRLVLKVAHIIEATDNNNPIESIDVGLFNDIENALICETQPLINKRGKNRYRGESMEIFNSGDFIPLSSRFKKATGEKCRSNPFLNLRNSVERGS